MKNFTFILILFFLITLKTNAQIPNGGFENWDNIGSFMEPIGFLTPNSEAIGNFYPITRSTDHYPTFIGDYSIRMENNTSLLPDIDGFGVVLQNSSNNLFDGPNAAFPIIGHPTSLTGYYKYAPQNGDTLRIQIFLSNQGSLVMNESFVSTDTIEDWTSFTIPFSFYNVADSGSILISAYNADGFPPEFVPRGNSVLYIDNLNFDELLNTVFEQNAKKKLFDLYPNPASDFVTLKTDYINKTILTMNIYNLIGERVRTEKMNSTILKIPIETLNNGVYMVEINSKEMSEKQNLIIQR